MEGDRPPPRGRAKGARGRWISFRNYSGRQESEVRIQNHGPRTGLQQLALFASEDGPYLAGCFVVASDRKTRVLRP